jgi:hypothetical protein
VCPADLDLPGWERSYGKCGACNGKGGKFANHAPRERVTRGGLGGRAR